MGESKWDIGFPYNSPFAKTTPVRPRLYSRHRNIHSVSSILVHLIAKWKITSWIIKWKQWGPEFLWRLTFDALVVACWRNTCYRAVEEWPLPESRSKKHLSATLCGMTHTLCAQWPFVLVDASSIVRNHDSTSLCTKTFVCAAHVHKCQKVAGNRKALFKNSQHTVVLVSFGLRVTNAPCLAVLSCMLTWEHLSLISLSWIVELNPLGITANARTR